MTVTCLKYTNKQNNVPKVKDDDPLRDWSLEGRGPRVVFMGTDSVLFFHLNISFYDNPMSFTPGISYLFFFIFVWNSGLLKAACVIGRKYGNCHLGKELSCYTLQIGTWFESNHQGSRDMFEPILHGR